MNGITLKKKMNPLRRPCEDPSHALNGQLILKQITLTSAGNLEEEEIADVRLDCQFCGRLFNPESHAKHQNKCNTVYMSRRLPFISNKQRMQAMPVRQA